MKKGALLLLMMLITIVSFGAGKELIVYSYDSMAWMEKSLIQEFEKENSCSVKIIKMTDAGKIAARMKLEKSNPKGDVVLGLNQSLAIKAKKEGLLVSYKPKNISKISNPKLIYDKEFYTVPFDYGALAFICNYEKMGVKPNSFEEFAKLDKSIIIQDPRISSTGQDFLLWTIAVYKDNWQEFWKKYKKSILTVAPGWSESFSKFEAGEAPVMVSYATDGAYSYYNYKSFKYNAVIPKEGAYLQLEGAGIIKGSKNIELSKKFIEFLLSEKVQNEIPLNQWMFPAVNVKLPDVFKYAAKSEKIVTLDSEYVAANMSKWLEQWEKIMK